jgi:hypothetical protein
MIFKNIFSSYYSFFLRQKATAPIYATVNLLALALMVWSMVIFGLLDKCFGFKLFSLPYFKFFLVVYILCLIFFLYWYCLKNKIKINDMIKVFDEKKRSYKILWGSISFIFLVLPIILCAILANSSLR